VLLIVAVLVFLVLRLTPGDPAAILAGDAASSEQIAEIRKDLGLDRSIAVQFGIWAQNLLRGEFGHSYFYKMEVTQLIGQRIEPTLALATLTILIAVAVSIPLGVIAAWRCLTSVSGLTCESAVSEYPEHSARANPDRNSFVFIRYLLTLG